MNELTATNVLPALLLCGLAGMVGQGMRAIVGLNKTGELEPGKIAHLPSFNLAYLSVTLMIGFIAGCLSGLIIGIGDFINQLEIDKLFAVVSAGYAGVDFIEGSFNLIIRQHSDSSAPDQPSVTSEETNRREPTFPTKPGLPEKTPESAALKKKRMTGKTFRLPRCLSS